MTIEDPLWMQGAAGSPSYSAREFRLLLSEQWDEGVASLAHFKVAQRAAGANFSVDVPAGVAVVKGDDQTNQGSYLLRSTAVENVVIGAAPGSNSRYDIVCLRINDPNAGGNAGYTATIVVTAGTPSASPAVPAVPASSLLLAIIGPIATATASITTSLIHDAQTGTGPTGVAAAHLMRGERAMPGESRTWRGPAGTVPNGWLLEDGSSQLRSALPDLFATIGVTNGAVDGTHFNLPDSRARVDVGLDNMGSGDAGRLDVANTLGGTGGAQYVQLSAAESGVAAHVHSITDPGHTHAGPTSSQLINSLGGEPGGIGTGSIPYGRGPTAASNTGITATNAAGAAAAAQGHNNMQPYLLANKIIRT